MKVKLLTFLLLALQLNSFGQTPAAKDCYEVKYLDFFGLEDVEMEKWEGVDLLPLKNIDIGNDRVDSSVKTSFFIPAVARQLEQFHPNCTEEQDTAYIAQLTALYCGIREINLSLLSDKTVLEQIDFMRDDFYAQVKDVDYLAAMTFTLDDGPFYGVDIDPKQALKPSEVQATTFGQLSISNSGDEIVLTATNKAGTILWQKSITGLKERYITKMHFREDPLEHNSVATKVHYYANGQRLTLYLTEEGEFMYYYHSW